ncbi:MAG: polysaccharide deacetylase family protein [Bacillota bacterium]|nr:polysaccharide deacetylase family protein [Bacillota bacterium]
MKNDISKEGLKLKKSIIKGYCIKLISLGIALIVCLPAAVRASSITNRDMEQDEEKILYLTFDDGPIPIITEKILDVLKEYGVKATFFVVGKEISGREDILKRIHNEGHGIGLHTFSHKFEKIYKSNDSFLEETDSTAALVEKLTGYRPAAVRFPGGSDRMLTPVLLQSLHERGYKVYDWNVSLEDGFSANLSVGTLIKNSKKVKGDRNRRFLLAHCNSNNKSTYLALPLIIQYYKSEGFEFRAIDDNTAEYYYKFRNKGNRG